MVLPVCRAPCIQLCHYACAELGNIVNELQGERIFWLCQFCVDASERAATAAGVPIYEGVVSAASESQSRGAKCVTNTVAGSVCVLRTELNAAVVFRVPCPVSRVPMPGRRPCVACPKISTGTQTWFIQCYICKDVSAAGGYCTLFGDVAFRPVVWSCAPACAVWFTPTRRGCCACVHVPVVALQVRRDPELCKSVPV